MNYHSLYWSSSSEWSIECSLCYQSQWHNLSGAIELIDITFMWVAPLLAVFISGMFRIRNLVWLTERESWSTRQKEETGLITQQCNRHFTFDFEMLGRDFVSMLSPARIRWQEIFDEESRIRYTMMLGARKVPKDFSSVSLYLNSLVQTDEILSTSCGCAYWQRPHIFARYIPKRDIYSMADMWLDFQLGVYRLVHATGLYRVDAKTNQLDIAILYIQTARQLLSILISILLSKRSSIINGS